MRSILAILFTVSLRLSIVAQNIPEGYLLQYQQSFNSGKALEDFEMVNPDKWGVFKTGSNFYLQCAAADSISEIPANVGVLINRIFGDFILEADVLPLKDSSGVAEICLFLGYRNLSKFYFVQLANIADSATNGIFLVKNGFKARLTGEEEKTASWNQAKWHKIRLVRDIIKRTIIVYLDNMIVPQMLIKDYELIMGSVGFGTNAGSARFDNIKIWAPTVLTEDELKEME
ncbi:MAG TPA: hypothetical protein VHI78_05370 [Bacteroidales bacterium]|jgi:hypothetical protein|nr:hypothetical protein [Bacteroidales bacterium]